MPTLHLMVGLPCSGKTTFAKRLEKEEGALRFTPDEWQLRLFHRRVYDAHSDHDIMHDRIEKIMWDMAADALRLGVNVILDFGFWAKAERDDLRLRARQMGVGFKIHFMDVPKDELLTRMSRRHEDDAYTTFVCETKYMEQWYASFQAPGEDELI